MGSDIHVIESPECAESLLSPVRRQILRLLTEEADSAAGLARKTGLARQKLNYHLREMQAQGLLREEGSRQRRGFVERLLRATAAGYVLSPSALGGLGPSPDRIANRLSAEFQLATAAQVIDELAGLMAGGKTVPTFTAEAEVRFASPAARAAFASEMSEAMAALIAKYHDESAPDGRTYRWHLMGHPRRDHAESNASTDQ